ncbi:MAG TPA: Uma2 family endonuclease [Kofleriaceae bacterium]
MVDSGKRRKASYRDVLRSPPHVNAEVIDGELFLSPRPGVPHARAITELLLRLGPRYSHEGPDGWCFLIEPELHLGGAIVVPDLAAWRRSNMPDVSGKYIDLAPVWVCEGLSASTMKLDRFRKLPLYAREGVEFAWLVDAIAWSLEVHGLTERRYELIQMFGDGDRIRAQPFEEVEFRLEDIASLPTRASERPIIYGEAALDLVRGASPAR